MALIHIKRSYPLRVLYIGVVALLFVGFVAMCCIWSITNTNRMYCRMLERGLPHAGTLTSESKTLDKSNTPGPRSIPLGSVPSIIARSIALPGGIRVARTVPTPRVRPVQDVSVPEPVVEINPSTEDYLSHTSSVGFWDGDSTAMFTNLTGYGDGNDWGLPGSDKRLFDTDFDWISKLDYKIGKEEIYRPEDCRPSIELAPLHFPPEGWEEEYQQEHYSHNAYAVFSFSFDNTGLKTLEFHEVFPDPHKEWWRFDYAVKRMLRNSAYRVPHCYKDTVMVMNNCRWEFCYGCKPSLNYNDTIVIVSMMR